jgi:hypothetical protein
MEHEFTLSGINASFLSSHMMELVIMLTGTILLSFVTARLFFKSSSGEKELVTMEVTGTESILPAHTVHFREGEIVSEKVSEQITVSEKKKTEEERYLLPEIQLQQSYTETNMPEEKEKVLVKHAKHTDDYLSRQPKDFYAIHQSIEAVNHPEESAKTELAGSKQLATVLDEYNGENSAFHDDAEILLEKGIAEKEKMPVTESKTFTAQLKELEQKKEKQTYTVVLLPKEEMGISKSVVADVYENEGTPESVKNGTQVNLLEEKVHLLQKERNDMMGQIFQLENRLKITYLTSLSKVDMEEEEENPIKRLTLYVSMLEGEKQGLNNKIADLSKKLSLAEAGASQIQSKENELTYVKSRLAALEQDKRDVQSQSGEWEVMYKKLYEKTHYLLSAKETELEQLKTNISYLEKDKSRLQERIKDMENELRSTVFNYKGRNPLAFNL